MVTLFIFIIEASQNQCDCAVEARDRMLPKLMNGESEV